jgi:hypothetical protein
MTAADLVIRELIESEAQLLELLADVVAENIHLRLLADRAFHRRPPLPASAANRSVPHEP